MEGPDTGRLTTRGSRKLSTASSGALSESRIPRPPLSQRASSTKSEDMPKLVPQRRSSLGSVNARSTREEGEEQSVHSGSDSDRVQVTIRLRPLRYLHLVDLVVIAIYFDRITWYQQADMRT